MEATAQPFLKWVGGKRRLVPRLSKLLPANAAFLRHIEPFAGGGAFFFARSTTSIPGRLTDTNPNLMLTYKVVRDDVGNLLSHLADLARGHSTARYYEVRARYNAGHYACAAELAAIFIYLNKTCFNGLYRVNRSGQFNVAAGRYKTPNILDEAGLIAASAHLRTTDLARAPFEATLTEAGEGDFVYLDPPYEPLSSTANFCSYAATGFSAADQKRLRDASKAAADRGAKVMVSNSDTPLIRSLYRDWTIERISAPRSVSCKVATREPVTELIIRSYAERNVAEESVPL